MGGAPARPPPAGVSPRAHSAGPARFSPPRCRRSPGPASSSVAPRLLLLLHAALGSARGAAMEEEEDAAAGSGSGSGLCGASLLFCLSLACAYVGSLYVWKSHLPR